MTSPGHHVRHEQTGVARLMETRKESEYPQAQALPVALGTPNLHGPPTSAEEYLAFVRHEAAQCPAVVRVAIDNKETNKSMSWYASNAVITEIEDYRKWECEAQGPVLMKSLSSQASGCSLIPGR
mmetsp:Transcript_32634/g.58421  ORF Transcript_32634/g.58421 Transcript_32634/m.58421 type:complete len:125 (-) Transcript_32634:3118-3492(-)